MLVNYHYIGSATYTKYYSKNHLPHNDNKRAIRINKKHFQLKKSMVQLKSPDGYLSTVAEPLIIRVVSFED